MSSAADGSRSHVSEPSAVTASANHPRATSSVERLSQHLQGGPAYFAASVGQSPPAEEANQPAGWRNLGDKHSRQALLHEDMFLAPSDGELSCLFMEATTFSLHEAFFNRMHML
ncbi:hypothetical protein PoB_002671200 [Plakobranchus ocellatus]|uniref:Uncharacterized protein n=1 Tax=Plakobranchus ocellatus TaxID=259542 RepID=A0AAV4A040_9GAST|nr:hypothetical protein PoB_002671200 [Plakobranchus ocellatus]